MSDLISRQAAIDALEKVAELFPWRVPGKRDTYDSYNEAWNDAIGRAEMEIENLPSAQPDYIMNEWCTDCKEYDHEKHCCPRFNRVIRQTLSEQSEIIYCKDCKYFERDIQRSWGTYNGCGVWTDDGNEIEVNQDDFCSYAERWEE